MESTNAPADLQTGNAPKQMKLSRAEAIRLQRQLRHRRRRIADEERRAKIALKGNGSRKKNKRAAARQRARGEE